MGLKLPGLAWGNVEEGALRPFGAGGLFDLRPVTPEEGLDKGTSSLPFFLYPCGLSGSF